MRAHGKLVKHEEARDNGDLVFIVACLFLQGLSSVGLALFFTLPSKLDQRLIAASLFNGNVGSFKGLRKAF